MHLHSDERCGLFDKLDTLIVVDNELCLIEVNVRFSTSGRSNGSWKWKIELIRIIEGSFLWGKLRVVYIINSLL